MLRGYYAGAVLFQIVVCIHRIGYGFEIGAKDFAEIRVCSVPLRADSLKRIVHPTLLCIVAMAYLVEALGT
jgi:hypothetical protein